MTGDRRITQLVNITRWVATIILGLIFFAALMLNISISTGNAKLLSADFYKKHLVDTNVYARVHNEILPEVASSAEFYGSLRLPKQDAQELLGQVFPVGYIQRQTENSITRFVSWFRSEADSLDITIDLTDPKTRAKTVVAQYIAIKVDALPQCSPGQDPGTGRAQAGELPSCIPVGMDRSAVKTLAISQVTPLLDQARGKWDVVQQAADGRGESKREFLAHFDDSRRLAKFAIGPGYILTFLAMVLAVLMIALLHVYSRKAMVRSVGYTVLICGLVVLVIALAAQSVWPDRIHAAILAIDGKTPVAALKLIADFASSASRDVAGSFVRPGVIVSGLGVFMVIVSWVVSEGKEQASSPAPKRGKAAR